jgi:hypothetical protein
MPKLCQFYGLAPVAIRSTRLDDLGDLVAHMNEQIEAEKAALARLKT